MKKKTEAKASTGMDEALDLLKKHWGYSQFRPAQARTIESVLAGYDTLAILSTGYGKSSCYQIPAMMADGCAIVISPLISLMKDQCDDCQTRGIPASYINSHVSDRDQEKRLTAWVEGEYRLLYISPERLQNSAFLAALPNGRVSYLVCDESHCHPAGTLVDTPGGAVPIEELKLGDTVSSWGEAGLVHRKVTGRASRDVPSEWLLKIVAPHRTLVLTSDHPVFVVGVGYVPASAVRPGYLLWVHDEAETVRGLPAEVQGARQAGGGVSVLQQSLLWETAAGRDGGPQGRALPDLPAAIRSGKQGWGPDDTLLFSQVLGEGACGQDGVEDLSDLLCYLHREGAIRTEVLLAGVWVQVGGCLFVGAHDPEKSNAVALSACASIMVYEATWGPVHAGYERWKRSGANRPAVDDLAMVSFSENGISCSCGEGLPWATAVREGRFGGRRQTAGNRGGRGVTQDVDGAGAGPGEGCSSAPCGVARVARVERVRPHDLRRGAPQYTEVFSLAVEGEHNYFAGGILCHNCVSVWGQDFRPAYKLIKEILPEIAYQDESGNWVRPPIIAFTATATYQIADDIAEGLGMDPAAYARIASDPVRANLSYEVTIPNGNGIQALASMASSWDPKGRYIVYCSTRKGTEYAMQALQHHTSDEFTIGYYHAGLPKATRIEMQDAFKSGPINVIAATSAFGMGIDVPDIRGVYHVGMPGSLEDYQQQAGRAGRDGLHSVVMLIHDDYSENFHLMNVKRNNPPYSVYVDLWEWLQNHVPPGEELTMSTTTIADQINGSGGSEAIGGALATMHAFGLVERSPVPYGSKATASVADMVKAAGGKSGLSGGVRKVAEAIIDHCIKPIPDGMKMRMVEFGLDKDGLANVAGCSVSSIDYALQQMKVAGLIEVTPLDYAKTTRVLKYGVALEECLPKDVVAAKRSRDFARYNAMVNYAKLPRGGHVPYLREYFLGPESDQLAE